MNTLLNAAPATSSVMAIRTMPAGTTTAPAILLHCEDYAVLTICEDAPAQDILLFLPAIQSVLPAGNVALAIGGPTGDRVQLLESSPSRDALVEAISRAFDSVDSNGTLTPVNALIAAVRQLGERPEADR